MNEIDSYLRGVPERMRDALSELRATIASAAPDAAEAISYQMPAFKYRGRVLVYYAAFKNHCSFFPASVAVIERFERELSGFRTSKGTVQFTPDDPLPTALVKKMVKARLAEIDGSVRNRPSDR